MGRFTVFVLSLLALILWIAVPEAALASETPQQKSERIRWWREARFGMFIHWGPVSLKGTEISWSRGGERRGIGGKGEIPVEVYDNLYRQFDPEKFNAAEWVSIAGSAGMKYMVLTAKHCDGFCLWRSAVDDYCMSATPFRRDVCGELASAAHAAGMRIGWYYSPMDWRDPDCRTVRNEVYLQKMRGHLRELLGNYGRIDLLWFDADGGSIPWDQSNTYALVRSLQPGMIVNDRLGLGPYNEVDWTRLDTNADYRTPEQRVGAFDVRIPWETCMTLGTQWSWKPNDRIKTAGECVRILVQCATGDGNLLLDVGPMPDGRIEPRQVDVLKQIGAWLAKYGESIYGTRGGPYTSGTWGGATRRGNALYLHIAKWEGDVLELPPLEQKIVRTTVLTGGTAKVAQTDHGIEVSLSAEHRDRYDTIVRLELDRSVESAGVIEVGRGPARGMEGASVRLAQRPDPRYPPGDPRLLVDGKRGSTDRTDGKWLAFEGSDFEAVIDLPAPKRVGRVLIGSLQEQVSRIFFPRKLEVSVAGDDTAFAVVGSVDLGAPVEDAEIRREDFSISFAPVNARRFRLRAQGAGPSPSWHPEAGMKTWMFVDEVVFGE